MNTNKFYQSGAILALLFIIACSTGRRSAQTMQPITKSIEILAVNDMHAAIDNFPRFGFIVDSLRDIYPEMLLFSAGDNQTGNPINDQYPEKGMPIIELMNTLKFDLSAVGNHEFDSKPNGFSNILKKSNFDFICGNVEIEDKKRLPIKPYKIIVRRPEILCYNMMKMKQYLHKKFPPYQFAEKNSILFI